MKLKTEQEQNEQVRMLADARDILNKYKIPAILTNSALLGAYRDGDLLTHCFGAVITTFRNLILPYEKEIINDIENKGYTIQKHFKNENYKIRFVKGRLNIEICAYSENDEYYYRKLHNKKKVIYKNFLTSPFGEIKIRGEKFITPQDIDGFLNFLYKDYSVNVKKSVTPTRYKTAKHVILDKSK